MYVFICCFATITFNRANLPIEWKWRRGKEGRTTLMIRKGLRDYMMRVRGKVTQSMRD